MRNFYAKGGNVNVLSNVQIELIREKLEKLIEITDSLMDSEIISVSQELDKLILKYYLSSNSDDREKRTW